MTFDPICQKWRRETECCANGEKVSKIEVFGINMNFEFAFYILADGTKTDTPPAGLDCSCVGATPSPKILFQDFEHFRMPNDGNTITIPASTIHSLSITGDFNTPFEYTVSANGDVKTYNYNNQFPPVSAVGEGSFLTDEYIITLVAGDITVHTLKP